MSSPFQKSFNSKSPLNSSSPDRVLGDRDIQRKLNKADRKFKKLKGDGSRRDIRKLEAGMLAKQQAERKRSGGVRGETPFFDAGHGLTVGKHNHPSLAPPDTNDDSEDSTADKNKGYTQWRYNNGNKKDNKRNLAKYKKFLADKESNKNEGN